MNRLISSLQKKGGIQSLVDSCCSGFMVHYWQWQLLVEHEVSEWVIERIDFWRIATMKLEIILETVYIVCLTEPSYYFLGSCYDLQDLTMK